MDSLVLHPTAQAQWHALVSEAEQSCAVSLADDIECYLVFLLLRFAEQPQLAESVMALEFLRSAQTVGAQRQTLLRDVGDKCLLYSGLFPHQAQQRRVRISYFVRLGQSAYGTLADRESKSMANLFTNLCERFVVLMDVLQAMRELAGKSSLLLPLDAAELWQDAHSQRALAVLKRYTQATLYHPSAPKRQH